MYDLEDAMSVDVVGLDRAINCFVNTSMNEPSYELSLWLFWFADAEERSERDEWLFVLLELLIALSTSMIITTERSHMNYNVYSCFDFVMRRDRRWIFFNVFPSINSFVTIVIW